MPIDSKITLEAAKKALDIRRKFGIGQDEPCDVFDLIARCGLSLRFTDTSSLAGLYVTKGKVGAVNVSALRPSGYRHSTAAHELGHHVFGHGGQVDEQIETLASPSGHEMLADTFARHLLMTRRSVFKGFASLGKKIEDADAYDFFTVASWLGVGYSMLGQHCRWTLSQIDNSKLHDLQKVQPKAIKMDHFPSVSWGVDRKEMWPVRPWWGGKRLHAQAGDTISGLTAPPKNLFAPTEGGHIIRGVGQVEVDCGDQLPLIVSISKQDYVGLYQYRYLEDPDA